MVIFIPGFINNFLSFSPHSIFQCIRLILAATGLKPEDLMCIGIKGHIPNLADFLRSGTLRKLIQKRFCRCHSRLITSRTTKTIGHRIGNIHHNNHSHIRILVNLQNIPRRAYLKRDIKHIFQIRSLDRFTNRYSILRSLASALIYNLNI